MKARYTYIGLKGTSVDQGGTSLRGVLGYFLLLLAPSLNAQSKSFCPELLKLTEFTTQTQAPIREDADEETLRRFFLSPAQRAHLVCQMRETMIQKYAGLHIKKDRLGLDVAAHLDGCASSELKDQESHPIIFYERLRRCIAQIRDTHLYLRPRGDYPTVATGIVLEQVGDRFFVSATNPHLLTLTAEANKDPELLNDLTQGSEVLLLDGQSPLEVQRDLIPFQESSSQAYQVVMANWNLTRRNFMYPKKNSLELTYKNLKGEPRKASLLWFARGPVQRLEARLLLKDRNIKTLNWPSSALPGKENLPHFQEMGYTLTNPLVSTNLKSYYDKEGYPVLRAAHIRRGVKRPFCYIQINSFDVDEIYSSLRGEAIRFTKPLREHILFCEGEKLPLVVDVRENGGGYEDFTMETFSYLIPSGREMPGSLSAFVNSDHTAMMISRAMYEESLQEEMDKHGFNDEGLKYLFDALHEGERTQAPHLPILRSSHVRNPTKGFHQPLLLLTSSSCISACDSFVHMFRNSKLGKVIGSPTNGTGAGYLDVDGLMTHWYDNRDFFDLTFPNFLFGTLPDLRADFLLDFEENKQHLTENVPAEVHVRHDTSLRDILTNGADWIEIIQKNL